MLETSLQSSAESPDGVWWFRDGQLRSSGVVVEPCTIDFFERWTFARFVDSETLVLAFESSQPWSEQGSYGDRYGGIQVLVRTEAATWTPVALEFDCRRHDESYIPEDATWHPRGALAWLGGGELHVQRLAGSSAAITWDLLPARDSDRGLEFSLDLCGRWSSIRFDASGRMLTAEDVDGVDVFDLELRLRARDGGDWVPIEPD